MNAFRTLFLVNVCMYIVVIFYFIKTQLMTFILVCGACRLNGKSLICLWYVFFVQLFLSHLATSLPERFFKMRFPFLGKLFRFYSAIETVKIINISISNLLHLYNKDRACFFLFYLFLFAMLLPFVITDVHFERKKKLPLLLPQHNTGQSSSSSS